METFERCHECGQLKDPGQGRVVGITKYRVEKETAILTKVIREEGGVIWVCFDCIGPSSEGESVVVDIPD